MAEVKEEKKIPTSCRRQDFVMLADGFAFSSSPRHVMYTKLDVE
jgi:hypothetical protein